MNTPSTPPACTVAVVDDDPVSTVMLERILSRSGFRVAVYTSGEALLAALPSSRPDVVCLDMSLPGIDGLETLRRVRTSEPQLPVILFSASAEEVRHEAIAAGAYACLDKAAAWNEVVGEVRRAGRRGR